MNDPDQWIRGQINDVLADGGHVHADLINGQQHCMGGDPECPLYSVQLEEAMEAWS